MASFNNVTLLGNICNDLELRHTPSQMPVLDFTLAINEKSKKGDTVSFIDCTCWNKNAMLMDEYMSKGKSILITGRLLQESWKDKESGKKRSKLKVTADRVIFVGGRDDVAQEAPQAPQAQQQAQQEQQQTIFDDTSVPF